MPCRAPRLPLINHECRLPPGADDLSVLATGATDSCVCCWDTRAGERVGTAAVACIQPE